MGRPFQLEVPPAIGFSEDHLKAHLEHIWHTNLAEYTVRLEKRSVDARSRNIKVLIQGEVLESDNLPSRIQFDPDALPYVADAPEVLIVGSGPAGMFAAVQLIELGLRPVVVERGGDVRTRRRDLAAINKHHLVNPESNYCFGEGGAGTYSDGKLYTRSVKRGNMRRILEILVAHGAKQDILFESHPHIGTNKLPEIVSKLRETILAHGGSIHFNTRVDDLIVKQGAVSGVVTSTGDRLMAEAVLLATGHSARDMYALLHHKKISIEAKPFALGVRIEHPQALIDQIQYHCAPRPSLLPASSYALVEQVPYKGVTRGAFSFCMCPGGFIVPAATSPGEIVVNGMSPSRRDSRFANSGMVVAVELEDIPAYNSMGPLAAMAFQQSVEQAAFRAAEGGQHAPAQRMTDFVRKKVSSSLNETSYQPGLTSADLWEVLPEAIAHRLKEAFIAFGKKKRGYLTEEANLVGVESRTSAPVRIPRDAELLQHPEIQGLYPCGEGAGYAGGILSAAMDGERVAIAIANRMYSILRKQTHKNP